MHIYLSCRTVNNNSNNKTPNRTWVIWAPPILSGFLILSTQFFLPNSRIFLIPSYCFCSALGLPVAWKKGKSQLRGQCWRREMRSCDKYRSRRASEGSIAEQAGVWDPINGLPQGSGGWGAKETCLHQWHRPPLPTSLNAPLDWQHAAEELKAC